MWQSPFSPSGITEETFLASSRRLGLVMSVVCMITSHWRRIASSTLGWLRPTALTATPAAMSMYRLPSGSLTVTPLPSERMTGKPPPPRVKDSYLADSSISALTCGPGASVTIFGAPSQDSSLSAASRVSVSIMRPPDWF